jgi:hypothetical protein
MKLLEAFALRKKRFGVCGTQIFFCQQFGSVAFCGKISSPKAGKLVVNGRQFLGWWKYIQIEQHNHVLVTNVAGKDLSLGLNSKLCLLSTSS